MKVRVPRDADPVHRGTLSIGSWTIPCLVGSAGLVPAAEKREGDGRTPIGIYPLRYGFHDPVERPGFGAGTVFPFVPMSGDMIWEEDPLDPHYNRLVFAQHGARPGDRLARNRPNGRFDLVIPIGYNDAAPEPHRGSAIFIHAARGDGSGTAGCIAVAREQMEELARRLAIGMVIDIAYEPA